MWGVCDYFVDTHHENLLYDSICEEKKAECDYYVRQCDYYVIIPAYTTFSATNGLKSRCVYKILKVRMNAEYTTWFMWLVILQL